MPVFWTGFQGLHYLQGLGQPDNIFVVHNTFYAHSMHILCYERNVVIAQAPLQSPMDRLNLRRISSKIYDRVVVLELEYIYLLYTSISGKKYDKFVVLESEYIYLLYTTVRCNKYDINVPGNGTL